MTAKRMATAWAAALLGLAGCTREKPAVAQARPAAPVMVARAERKDAPVELKVIGNVEAYASITIKSRVGGELVKVNFREGDFVSKDDLLFEIDPRTYQSAVRRAEAAVARDTALMKQFEANLARDIAQEDYPRQQAVRYLKLFQEGVVSREQYDEMRTKAEAQAETIKADRAAIDSARETIRADNGALDAARLELSFSTIRSPLDGRTGNLAIKQGTIVKATDIDLVTINQVQPIYVTFAVPESSLGEVKRRMAAGKLPVSAVAPDQGASSETGVLTFIDNAVDTNTGTIKLKGTFDNRDRVLWPGQFVNVNLRLNTLHDATLVPSSAVQLSQQGPFVYVVKADNTVEMRTVKTGARVDQATVIAEGLAGGETVVTDGHLRLSPGAPVQIRNAPPQAPEAAGR